MTFTPHEKEDEKIPLATRKPKGDMGAIPESAVNVMKRDDERRSTDKKESSGGDPEPDPMSLRRKFVMFLSVNCGIFYVAFFAVILPCRQECALRANGSSANLQNSSATSNASESHAEVVTFRYLRATGSDIVCEFGRFSPLNMHLELSPKGCHCSVVNVNNDRSLRCIFNRKRRDIIWETSEGKDIQEEWYLQTVDYTPGLILRNCIWKNMCLYFPSPQDVQTSDVVIKERDTKLFFRDVIFSCNERVVQHIAWTSEKKLSVFTFNCSYS